MLLEGQLDEEESDELELSSEVSAASLEADDSPEDDDPPPPPPLQEIARILKQYTIRKKRSFFIYFP